MLVIFNCFFFLIKTIKYLENSQLNTLIFLSPGFFVSDYEFRSDWKKRYTFSLVIAFFVFFRKKIRKHKFICFANFISFFYLSHIQFFYFIYLIYFFYFF